MDRKNINKFSSFPTSFNKTNESDLFQIPVTLDKINGKVTINAVYQDTHLYELPLKGRTVVMLHGSPGSHKDFKYVVPLLRLKGIRSIAINWPGLGYSEYDDKLKNDNLERTEYVQSIINSLKLQKPLIFLGHSRGVENAFRLAERNEEKTIGVVAANFVGTRPHKAVRPFFALRFLSALWDFAGLMKLQFLLEPLFKAIYAWVGFKTPSGYMASICLKTMTKTDFDDQLKFIFPLRMNQKIQLLLAYSGEDHLIEPELSEELLDDIGLKENCRLVTETIGDEQQIIENTRKLIREGHKNIAVYFACEGHFLQKFRCKFLADSIVEMFDEAENNSKL